MKLKMKDVAYLGPMYYAQDGIEYGYYGKAAILVNGSLAMCQVKEDHYFGHGGSDAVIKHKWVDVLSGDSINKEMRNGFEVADSEIGHSFRKAHHPSECNPW